MGVLDWVLFIFLYFPLFMVAAFAYLIFIIAPIFAFAVQIMMKRWENLEKILDKRDS